VTPEPLDLIEERLHANGRQVTRRGDRLEAQCPAHEDSTPSLSVAVGTKRDVVICCHAGCRTDDVLDALSLTFKELSPPTSGDGWVAEWVYRDEQNRPLFRVVKYPGKQFRQHAYDPATGEFQPKLGSTRRVLYRLPEFLEAAAAGETIWIAEGEKDVDRLVAAGVQATCNPGGAKKFRPEYVEALKGAGEVVLVADRDTTGLEHVDQVAALLNVAGIPWRAVQARSGKDAYDHLTLGHTVDEFDPVNGDGATLAAPAFLDNAHLVDWASFWQQEHTDEDWVAWPLAPRGRTISFYAPAKAGKSTIVLSVVAAAATGRSILGIRDPAEPIRVLYLDYEMNQADLYERLSELGYGAEDDLSRLHYALLPSLQPLDTPEGAEEALELAIHLGVELVVIDTFGRAVQGGENEADTVRDFYRLTAQRLKQGGISVLRTDHSGKDLDKGQRGSSAKNDDVDVVWRLARTETGVRITRTHSRVTWVPDELEITRIDHRDGRVTYEILEEEPSYPEGTRDVVARLDALDVPVDASANQSSKALIKAGQGARRQLVVAAQAFRKRRDRDRKGRLKPVDNYPVEPVDNSGTTPGTTPFGETGNRRRNHAEPPPANPVTTPGTTLGTTGNHLSRHNGNHPPPPIGGVVPEADFGVCTTDPHNDADDDLDGHDPDHHIDPSSLW
jgi:hypothetical protein